MRTAAPGERDGGEKTVNRIAERFDFTASAAPVQAPANFQHVGDIAARLIARIGRHANLYPRLAVGGRS